SGRSVTAVKQDFHAAQLLKNLALLMQHLLQPVIEQRQVLQQLSGMKVLLYSGHAAAAEVVQRQGLFEATE
ncbi:hypothetical protein, partial [Aquipseudomonas alcaligenes]|uniref:hypothetical protein n=1 Tax=Aquipseudomonas alcaligenes TaxID=43263 RepID=UPI001C7ED02D